MKGDANKEYLLAQYFHMTIAKELQQKYVTKTFHQQINAWEKEYSCPKPQLFVFPTLWIERI